MRPPRPWWPPRPVVPTVATVPGPTAPGATRAPGLGLCDHLQRPPVATRRCFAPTPGPCPFCAPSRIAPRQREPHRGLRTVLLPRRSTPHLRLQRLTSRPLPPVVAIARPVTATIAPRAPAVTRPGLDSRSWPAFSIRVLGWRSRLAFSTCVSRFAFSICAAPSQAVTRARRPRNREGTRHLDAALLRLRRRLAIALRRCRHLTAALCALGSTPTSPSRYCCGAVVSPHPRHAHATRRRSAAAAHPQLHAPRPRATTLRAGDRGAIFQKYSKKPCEIIKRPHLPHKHP